MRTQSVKQQQPFYGVIDEKEIDQWLDSRNLLSDNMSTSRTFEEIFNFTLIENSSRLFKIVLQIN